ncbi:MAG: GNAT family N-acetyltransferase [Cyclobacteriaceae bacterium]
MITVKEIRNKKDQIKAQEIRHEVFVIGQNVPAELEVDEYESDAIHYLAFLNNNPVGAARWRITEQGVKLERFAVLNEFRGRGIGSAMVEKILSDIKRDPEAGNKEIYLHAQMDAIPLYRKFGFVKYGNMFDEAGLMHYAMKLPQ